MNSDNLNQNGTVLGNVEPIDTLDATPPVSQPNNTVLTNNTPEPAFTNPQVINPSPLAGNTNTQPMATPQPVSSNPVSSNQTTLNTNTPSHPVAGLDGSIGVTPPVSLEPEKKPKKGMNKFVFVILIIVVLAGIGFGTYYVLNYTNLLKKGGSITITPKELQFNIGDDLPTSINEYAVITGTDTKNCSFDTSSVNMLEEGSYSYKITCGNKEQTGTISVVDDRELEVVLKPVYKKIGDELKASEFAKTEDETYTYEFNDEEKVKSTLNGETGVYSIPIKVSTAKKSTEVMGTLVILKNEIKGFMDCSTSASTIESINATLTKSLSFSIVNDGSNGFGGYAVEKNIFKFNDESNYSSKLSEYNENKTLTIENITGTPTFDDASLTITFEIDKVTAELNEEYGANNISSYSTILNHFTKELKYTCVYNKIERNA